jgi:predicted RNA-binding Zn-ribbon protein involved in translation (DUF1610 family)
VAVLKSAPMPAPDCTNCGASLGEPRPKFCPACGQETNLRPPRLMEFVQQFGGAYFSTEGALWRTLKLLLLKPGELTRQYLAGRRKHYVLPLRLYLSVSLIALLALRIVTSFALEQADAVKIDLKDGVNLISFGPNMQAGTRDGVFFCNGFPPWVCKRIERRIALDEAGLVRQVQELGPRFVSNAGVAMFVLVPLFALLLKLVYWNRRLRYTEHLVFALHVHSVWFLIQLLLLPDWAWLSALAWSAIPLYTILAMRTVYAGRWWPRLLRAALLSLLYFIALILALIVVGLWTVIF